MKERRILLLPRRSPNHDFVCRQVSSSCTTDKTHYWQTASRGHGSEILLDKAVKVRAPRLEWKYLSAFSLFFSFFFSFLKGWFHKSAGTTINPSLIAATLRVNPVVWVRGFHRPFVFSVGLHRWNLQLDAVHRYIHPWNSRCTDPASFTDVDRPHCLRLRRPTSRTSWNGN